MEATKPQLKERLKAVKSNPHEEAFNLPSTETTDNGSQMVASKNNLMSPSAE